MSEHVTELTPAHAALLAIHERMLDRLEVETPPDVYPFWDPAATNVIEFARNGPGLLWGWHLVNTNAAAAYLHLYDRSSETPGASPTNLKPYFTLQIPPNTLAVPPVFLTRPVRFMDAISYAVTANFGTIDGDGAAPAAPCPIVLFIA